MLPLLKPKLIKPTKTRKEIASEYGICTHTLKRWIKRANLQIPSGDLPPKMQHLIYAAFGEPPTTR